MPRRSRFASWIVTGAVAGVAMYLLAIGHGAEPVVAVVLAFIWGALARWPGAVFLYAYLAAIIIDPRPDPAPIPGLEIPDTKVGNAIAGLFFIVPAFAIGAFVGGIVTAIRKRRIAPRRPKAATPQPLAEPRSANAD